MDKEYDIVIFGASGVTGKFIVEELALNGRSIKWAVAGRSKTRLSSTLLEAAAITGIDLKHVGMIAADVNSESSLIIMALKTKVLVNCVGPFRFFGERVVSACVSNKTHYIDVCGEPQFLEHIQQKYFEQAFDNNTVIIGACGFDSMPCDMGVEFMKHQFIRNGPSSGHLNSVESFLEIRGTKESKVNFATWQSAIHSIAHADELKDVRRRLKQKVFPEGTHVAAFPLKPRSVLFKSEVVDKWCVPFLGSDKSVVFRTQMFQKQYESKKPVQIQTYFCVSSFLHALLFIFMGWIFYILCKFEVGRSLLERYPGFFSCGVFSKDPPTRRQMTGGSFVLTLSGSGWSEKIMEDTCPPDKTMVVKVTGPDAGYGTTAICIVAACKVLLDPRERRMTEFGGVFTPAAAFSRTDLVSKLHRRGIKIMVAHEDVFRRE